MKIDLNERFEQKAQNRTQKNQLAIRTDTKGILPPDVIAGGPGSNEDPNGPPKIGASVQVD